MRVEVGVDYAQVSAAADRFAQLEEKGVNVRPALERAADEIAVIERRRFDGDNTWHRDTAAWIGRKGAEGGDERTLVYRGDLERSLTQPGSKDSIRRFGVQTVTVGTKDVAATMQGRGVRGTAPRPPLDLSPADEVRLAEVIEEWLVQGDTGFRLL